MCNAAKQPIGMTPQRADDLRTLNEQIEATEAFLASLRQSRERLMGGGGVDGHDTPVELSTMNFSGETLDQLRAVNGHLANFKHRYEEDQRRIDEDFDQRLANDATEPQRDFSDCH